MQKLMLLYLLSVSLAVLGDQAPDSCSPYVLCDDFQGFVETGDISDINDIEIAKTGHMSGLKPESYQLLLHFEDLTQYTGSINITVKVVQRTNRAAIHLDITNVEYDVAKTVIHHDCNYKLSEFNCLEKAAYDKEKKLLLLWLKHEILEGLRVTLQLKGFSGQVYDGSQGTGSIALNLNIYNDVEAVYTNFLSKLASTVFPCFDHPSLKVKIQLCLEYPEGYSAASTARPLESSNFVDSEHSRQCFEYTPVIPVYVFAFTIMKHYMLQGNLNTLETILYVPTIMTGRFNVLHRKLRQALQIVRIILGTALPLRRISILLVYIGHDSSRPDFEDKSSLGVQNAGLISLFAHQYEDTDWEKRDTGDLYRAIVHQWIGAGFTVSHWGEVCLQHGLAQYLEWKLLHHFENVTVQSTIDKIPRRFINEQHPPMHYYRDDYPADHNPGCLNRAALIFNMVAEVFGFAVVQGFAANLSKTFANSNANMSVWDKTLTDYTNTEIMNGYITSWFTKFTPVVLNIRFFDHTIIVEQNGNFNWTDTRPIPVKICTSNHLVPQYKVFNTITVILSVPQKPEWIIVDPTNALLAVKCYESNLYQDTLTQISVNNKQRISEEWRKNYLNSFCDAVLSNRLPLPLDMSVVNWRSVFDKAHSFETSCDCCLVRSSLRPQPKCYTKMGARCDRIEIVSMLGYNTLIENTDYEHIFY